MNGEKALKLVTVAFVVCFATLIFAMFVIRSKCVTKGYEQSRIVQEIESRRLVLERVEQERAALVSSERLYPIAVQRGFVLMQEGKTFNVQ